MKLYIMLIKPHSNSSQYVEWSKTKGFVYDVNNTEVFDEQYIEWFKGSAYYMKGTLLLCFLFSYVIMLIMLIAFWR